MKNEGSGSIMQECIDCPECDVFLHRGSALFPVTILKKEGPCLASYGESSKAGRLINIKLG